MSGEAKDMLVDRETVQTLLDLLNPLHGALDLQTYDEKVKENFDAPRDAEYAVNVTAQQERDLTQAVCILESRLKDDPPQPSKRGSPDGAEERGKLVEEIDRLHKGAGVEADYEIGRYVAAHWPSIRAALQPAARDAVLEELKNALRPFAEVLKFFPPSMHDMEQVSGGDVDGDQGITVGDLRRAKAALKSTTPGRK